MASGLTQKEICDRLGKQKNYIIKVERGERRLDVVELFALCETMNADAIQLLQSYAEKVRTLRQSGRGAGMGGSSEETVSTQAPL